MNVKDAGIQVPLYFSNETPRKTRLRAMVKKDRNKCMYLKRKLGYNESTPESVIDKVNTKMFKLLCDKFLPQKASKFVQVQVDLFKKKKEGEEVSI